MKCKEEIKSKIVNSYNKDNCEIILIAILFGALIANIIGAGILWITEGLTTITTVITSFIPILLFNTIILKYKITESDNQ